MVFPSDGAILMPWIAAGEPAVRSGLIADQLVAATPIALGLVCVTEVLTIRYRRPIPLDVELTLEARCERDGDDRVRARCTIAAGTTTCLEADAEMVVAPQVTAPARADGGR